MLLIGMEGRSVNHVKLDFPLVEGRWMATILYPSGILPDLIIISCFLNLKWMHLKQLARMSTYY